MRVCSKKTTRATLKIETTAPAARMEAGQLDPVTRSRSARGRLPALELGPPPGNGNGNDRDHGAQKGHDDRAAILIKNRLAPKELSAE